MARIKYMGSADIRVIDKGHDFNGRLVEGLSKGLVFSEANRWIVDTDEAELSAEAVELLVGDPDFKDVSDAKTIPSNLHQRMFKGHGATDALVPPTIAQVGEDAASGGTTTTTGGGRSRAR